MRKLSFFLALFFSVSASAQKIEDIYFNLYTDSLKKGFYNYINVDGKSTDGRWLPLDTTQVRFTANAGRFNGNAVFIDSSYTGETITVKAVLKKDPSISKEIVIYIRKRGFDEPLKTSNEILQEIRTKPKKGKQHLVALNRF